MTPSDAFHIVVNPGDSGQRLDVFIASRIAGLSRSRSASLILAEIPEKALTEVSINQNKSFDEVFQIYKKIVLWNSINN